MANLVNLRNRKKKLQQQKIERIQEEVVNVVNSHSFVLTAANHLPNEIKDDAIGEFAKTLAQQVTGAVLNPVNDFIDTCKVKLFSDKKIKEIVEALNQVFQLTHSAEYEDKLEAVAEFMSHNPYLYEDLRGIV